VVGRLEFFPFFQSGERGGALSFRNITRGDLSECKTVLNILKSFFLLKRGSFLRSFV
jgi:hypothetical protein